ncbi:sulfatase-like hydrolase/transferase [Flavivirga sp. 57AJ16]|uniref:sulfatase-like hydrolase/transferase n=1 Tax=Flavivirga sp. 57AJ16 TaxID=3025307 RepID=UPI00236689AF|nr:sulfatase-like hydrolase/transferase [Flavivirga sp. 57AJ16]MDD7885446.1 sulfatase-like hydrolase/transferase [Flavivirga sp. 57AJ16]
MQYFKSTKLIFILLIIVGYNLQAQTPKDRPNILIIFSDDQRADAVGYENEYVKTPNIDRLAASGMKFTNMYCMGADGGAVCVPSRAMLMTGKYVHKVRNDMKGVETMPQMLGKNGYVTFGTGKWHNKRPSFNKSFQQGNTILFAGMSDHFNVPVVDKIGDGKFSEERTVGHSSEVFADAAIDFLNDYAKGDRSKPFFTYVAFTASHDPRTPPKEYLDMYNEEGMPLPPNYLPVHLFNNGEMNHRDERLAAYPRSTKDIKSSIAEYYGLISHMDAQIGRILETLRTQGLLENTIIVYTSDHGLALGSHGLLGKQSLYEHSMKSPFVITGPGIPVNKQSDAMVYLLDIYPTLLDLIGMPAMDSVDGADFAPIIRGEKAETRNSLYTTFTKNMRAVRGNRWKLIRYPALRHTQLFDLASDPYELNNVAALPENQERVEQMMDLLKEWQQETGDTLPLTASEKQSMAFDVMAAEKRRKPDGHQPEYILKKYFNGK